MKPFVSFLIFLFAASPIIAQNSQTRQESSDSRPYVYVPPPVRPTLIQQRSFLFTLDMRIGGLMALPYNSPFYTALHWAVQLGGIIPVYKNLFIDARFRVGGSLTALEGPLSNILPMVFHGSVTMGFYVGVGGIVKDWRIGGRGWAIFLSGGFVMDFAVRNFFVADQPFTSTETIYQMFSVGAELSTRMAYYMHANAAVTFGAYLGLSGAPFVGDPFYVDFNPLVVGFIQIAFGVSLGFIF